MSDPLATPEQRPAPDAGAPPPRPARPVLAQARAEVLMTLRRGESLLLTIVIPVVVLVFFAVIKFPAADPSGLSTIGFLTPGVLALAVMSTAMVSLGIATAFERQYGVLKRLRLTPLGRPALLAAKTIAVGVVETAQTVVLVGVAFALGWRPEGDALVVVMIMALATVAFAGLGQLMAGTLRAEMTLATANGLYLVLLLLGGMVVPLTQLPDPIRLVANLLPAAALSEALRHVLGTGSAVPGSDWLVLVGWAIAAPAAAARLFRWE
jgi:ABC-2 type transport system permease protein